MVRAPPRTVAHAARLRMLGIPLLHNPNIASRHFMALGNFDPNAASSADSGIFGLPHSEDDSHVVFIPVPWEATTSYGGGTVDGPQAILSASRQVDLYHRQVLRPYEAGLHMRGESGVVRIWNDEARPLARNVIATGGRIEGSEVLRADLDRVNELSETPPVPARCVGARAARRSRARTRT